MNRKEKTEEFAIDALGVCLVLLAVLGVLLVFLR